MKVVKIMSKILKKIGRVIYTIFSYFFKFVDKWVIMPISRIVYNIFKSTSGNNNNFNKLLNRPHFLIVISLIFSIICFLLIDNKVISLVENEAEIIKNVPVNLIYNAEAYVVENVPETVDITITGRKSDIYLAKQLGEFAVELDLSKYTEPGTYKVYFTYSKSIDSVDYILDPSYLSVTIKDKVSEVHSVSYDLVSTDDLDEKLSVDSVTLDSSEVIVKGSQDALDKIASIKALVSVSSKDDNDEDTEEYTEKGTYEMTNIPLVAYDKKGEIINNVEIVPHTLTGTLVLKSYSVTVPLSVSTTGKLISGKAIASITINNQPNYSLDIYGEEEEIKEITSVPVTINVDGLGSEGVKNYKVTISKPSGVRYMSVKNATITATFGDEAQKTIDVDVIDQKYLADGYSANIVSSSKISIQVKGVQSNIDKITAGNIKAYVDLSGLGEGTHEVAVKVDNNNPLINYVVSSTISIKITKD
ncbi:MAG: hypothetical protein E7161_05235 [Firmicutes bacterium]|nr:hypothetical protein [Bacillota bacterium]